MPDPPAHILFCDLDDTLLGDDAATQRFAAFVKARRQKLAWVTNSSRFVASQQRSLATTALPAPDLFVGGMGTEIALPVGGSRLPGAAALTRAWTSRHAAGWNLEAVCAVLEAFPGVVAQAPENQSRFKQSRFLRGAGEEDLHALRAAFAAAGLAVRVTYSSDRDLDVTPAGADKATAVRYLIQGLGFDDDHAAVAGDSGNDRAMLTCGALGIVVANHQRELADLAGPRILRATRAHADGVIEGLLHWFASLRWG